MSKVFWLAWLIALLTPADVSEGCTFVCAVFLIAICADHDECDAHFAVVLAAVTVLAFLRMSGMAWIIAFYAYFDAAICMLGCNLADAQRRAQEKAKATTDLRYSLTPSRTEPPPAQPVARHIPAPWFAKSRAHRNDTSIAK